MPETIKYEKTEDVTIFTLSYNESNLKVFNEDLFKKFNINAEVSIVLDNMKGGNGFFSYDESKLNKSITIPYRYFHYKAKLLNDSIFGESKDTIRDSKPSTFVNIFKDVPKISNYISDKLNVFKNNKYDRFKKTDIQEPVVQEPVVQEPVVQEPVVQEPVVQEPVVQEPVVQEPVVQEPIVQEPVVQEPEIQTIKIKIQSENIKKIDRENISYKEVKSIYNTLLDTNTCVIWEKGIFIIDNKICICELRQCENNEYMGFDSRLLKQIENSEVSKGNV